MPFACYRQQKDGSEKGFPKRLPPHQLMSGNTPFEDGTRLLLKGRDFYAFALAPCPRHHNNALSDQHE